MTPAPKSFQGSWLELFQKHIEPNIPSVEAVCQFHDWLIQYCQDAESIFPVRYVRGTERRKIYVTADGTKIAPADNSPAWVTHALLMRQRLADYPAFKALMLSMPTHMFDIRRVTSDTANAEGWYIAHIYPAKNRDTGFQQWTKAEVIRRFLLCLHPCNLFLVPMELREAGEAPRVIAFMAEQYAIRYASVWEDLLHRISAKQLVGDCNFGAEPVATKANSQYLQASK